MHIYSKIDCIFVYLTTNMYSYDELSTDDLGYFDSDESYASDYVEESEEENNFFVKNVENTFLVDMIVPMDIMNEIIYYTNIPTFIKISTTSKKIKTLCNNMWITKLNQNNIIVKQGTNVEECIIVYKNYINNNKIYQVVDVYMQNFCHCPIYDCYDNNKKIIMSKLDKCISDDQLQMFINKKHAKNSPCHKNNSLKFLPNKHGLTIIMKNKLTYKQLRELIFQLFYHGYLDKNNTYFFNDYNYYVTSNDAYYRGY